MEGNARTFAVVFLRIGGFYGDMSYVVYSKGTTEHAETQICGYHVLMINETYMYAFSSLSY